MTDYRVLVSDKLAQEGIEKFKAEGIQVDYRPGLKPEELLSIIGDYDGLAIRSGTKVNKAVFEKTSRLKVVGRAGIGVDNVDLKAAKEHKVIVMNTPHGNTVTTAEHTIALLFSLVRQIPAACSDVKKGLWPKSAYEGRELFQKKLGIIGLGNIGKIVADRANGLKMHVLASDPHLTPEGAKKLGVERVELSDLFKNADIITLHVPLVESTKKIINRETLKQIKKGAFLINCARGGLVDEFAVFEALQSGHLAGAAFDVFEEEPPKNDHPLFAQPNFIATPHLGASTFEAQVNVAVQVAEQIARFLKTGDAQNVVNG